MKFTISFIFLFLSFSVGLSQSKMNIVLKITDAETACAKDNTHKIILFQYKYKEGYRNIKSFVSAKCFNSFTIPKTPGEFRLFISAKNYKPEVLDFEITEQTKDALYLDDLYLSRAKKEIISKKEEKIKTETDASVMSSAQSKITLAIKIMDTEIPCAKDSTRKNVLFQYKHDGIYEDIKNFVSTKCFNTYTISKTLGKFRLSVTSKDHVLENFDFEITNQTKDTLYFGELYLSQNSSKTQVEVSPKGGEREIEGIVVSGVRQKFVTFDANKTTYKVKDNDLLSGGNTEDAIKKLPGVIKGYGGDLTANGKSMSIYIDGASTGLSSTDLENLLQSIPASSIEKIEMIYNPGAAYEANIGGGIINIITSGRASRGLNGTATLNYRFNENNKVSPSININSRINSKMSLQLNTGFNYRETERISKYTREFTSFNPSITFDQDNKNKSYNRYYFFRPSANINLTNTSKLLLNYNFGYTYNSNYFSGLSISENNREPVDLLSSAKAINNNTNNEVIVKYINNINNFGKLDVSAYYSHFNRKNEGTSSQINLGQDLYSISKINLNYDNFYTKVDLEIPFKKLDFSINLGGKYSTTNSSSLGQYNLLNKDIAIFDTREYNSNIDFKYDDSQYSFYTEFNKKINKLSFTAGLRYENIKYKSYVKEYGVDVNNKFDEFYPNVNLLYRFTDIFNLNASYRKSFTLPSYTNLDPNINGYFDQYNTSTGNQFLKPDFYDNYEVSLSAWDYLKFTFLYTRAKQISLLSFDAEDQSLSVNRTTRTYNRLDHYNVSLAVPIPWKLITQGKKLFQEPMKVDEMTFFYFYSMLNYYKLGDYPYTETAKPLWVNAIYSQIILPKDFRLYLFYVLTTSGGYWQMYKANKSVSYSSMELSKSFYNKSLKATFGIENLFHDDRIDAQMLNKNLITNLYQRDETRIFYIKLSYNFGKSKDSNKKEAASTILDIEHVDSNEEKKEGIGKDKMISAPPTN